MNIELKILNHKFYKPSLLSVGYGGDSKNLPHYATQGSAGVDLYATRDYVLAPQERIRIPTGIAVHIGSGNSLHSIAYYENSAGDYWENREYVRFKAVISPRSGRGTDGLVLANAVGIIDEDYQGEIIVSAWNSLQKLDPYTDAKGVSHWPNVIEIKAGDRIAQMAIVPVVVANWVVVDEFTESTDRGKGGFGSTGE